jgi:hypothetical protein
MGKGSLNGQPSRAWRLQSSRMAPTTGPTSTIVALRHLFRLDCVAHQSGGCAPKEGDDTHVQANTSDEIAPQATRCTVSLRAKLCAHASTQASAR